MLISCLRQIKWKGNALLIISYSLIEEKKRLVSFNCTVPAENIFFIIRFYAIMHRTTIVQNKIISTICSWLFFYLVNIYRPSLGKVRLGRPNPKLIQPLNFYLRRKRNNTFYSELYTLQQTEAGFSIFIFIYLKKKIGSENLSKCLTIYIIIIN